MDHMIGALNREYGLDIEDYAVYGDVSGKIGRYTVLLESPVPDVRRIDEFCNTAEKVLSDENPYYGSLVRDRVLDRMRLMFVRPGTFAEYRERIIAGGTLSNQIKPVRMLNTPERKEFFLSRVMM